MPQPSRFAPIQILSSLAVAAFLSAGARAQSIETVIPQPHLALVDAGVIDLRNGNIREGMTVVLREGRIVSVTPGAEASLPPGVETIDLEGRYLLPGLIDAHTHLDRLDQAERALHSGVTTLRGASVGSYRDVALGEMSAKGYIAGPDYLGAGVYVTPSIGEAVLADPRLLHMGHDLQSLEDLRHLVRVNIENGARVIKTRGTERAGRPETDPREQVYTEEQLRAVVEEARLHGVSVLCHAHGDEGAYAAVMAGVRSIDHGTYMTDRTLKAMKERGTYFVPTYTTMIDLIEPGGDYDHPVTRIRGMHMLPRIQDTFARALELGIPIVTGADSSYGPESITRISMEMTNFVELGMSPLQAIQSATSLAAEMLGIADRTGRIEPGLEADLIVVEGNPLEDIRFVQDIIVVISNGRLALNRLPFRKDPQKKGQSLFSIGKRRGLAKRK